MRTRTVDLGDVFLEVLEAGGAGDRPLLLVHGFTGAKEDFGDAVGPLAAGGWHVVAPDLRGHGASSKPIGTASYSLGIFEGDVIALVDALGWDRFTLLGHSMGGMVAQLVALDHGSRLDGLVLMDTSPSRPDGLDDDVVAFGAELVRTRGTEALVGRTDDSQLAPAQRRVLAVRPGYREFGDAKLRAAADDMWLAMVPEMLSQPDRLERLRELHVPTLVIVGEEDAGFLAHSQRMADAIPGAELVVVPDAAHSPQFENRDEWEAALVDFLDVLPRGEQ